MAHRLVMAYAGSRTMNVGTLLLPEDEDVFDLALRDKFNSYARGVGMTLAVHTATTTPGTSTRTVVPTSMPAGWPFAGSKTTSVPTHTRFSCSKRGRLSRCW